MNLRRISNNISTKICILLFFVVGVDSLFCGCDDGTDTVTDMIRNYDGTGFEVVRSMKEPRRYGHPDIYQIGGSRKTQYSVMPLVNKSAVWDGVCLPVGFHKKDNKYYLIVLDSHNPLKAVFRYYNYDTNWTEIKREKYPRQMAIQNLSLSTNNGFDSAGSPINEAVLVSEMNVSNAYFQTTMTAYLWKGMINGKEYYKNKGTRVEMELLMNYKNQYISSLPSVKTNSLQPFNRGIGGN